MLVGVWLGLLWVSFHFFDHHVQSSVPRLLCCTVFSHGPMRNIGFLGRWGTHACPQCLPSDIVPVRSWTRTLRRPGIRHRHLPCHAMPCHHLAAHAMHGARSCPSARTQPPTATGAPSQTSAGSAMSCHTTTRSPPRPVFETETKLGQASSQPNAFRDTLSTHWAMGGCWRKQDALYMYMHYREL